MAFAGGRACASARRAPRAERACDRQAARDAALDSERVLKSFLSMCTFELWRGVYLPESSGN